MHFPLSYALSQSQYSAGRSLWNSPGRALYNKYGPVRRTFLSYLGPSPHMGTAVAELNSEMAFSSLVENSIRVISIQNAISDSSISHRAHRRDRQSDCVVVITATPQTVREYRVAPAARARYALRRIFPCYSSLRRIGRCPAIPAVFRLSMRLPTISATRHYPGNPDL